MNKLGMSLCAATVLAQAAWAQGPWREEIIATVPAGQELRGFGRVGSSLSEWRGPGEAKVGVWRFSCANGANAKTLIGKFLADLDMSPGLQRTTVAGVPAAVLPRGIFVGCVAGAEGRVLYADSPTVLEALAKAQPGLFAGAVAQAPYPAWLDRFDRYGWGCYGMGGYNNFHDWMRKSGDPKQPKNPDEDVQFMLDKRFRFEPWLDPSHFDTSDGIVKNNEVEWQLKRLHEAGMPYSFRVYGNAGGADWTARRFPEYAERPAPFMMSGWHGAQMFWRAQPHLTWFDHDIHRYLAVKTMDMMKPHANDPFNMGWMHPHGELAHDPWYDMHDDYSPAAQHHWQAFLQVQGLSLAEVARMYGRETQPFVAWEQVSVPEFATFAGLGGQVLSLEGTWFWRRERNGTTKEDGNFPGLSENWQRQPFDAKLWQAVQAPGSEALYGVLPKELGWFGTTWFRRSFTLTAEQLAAKPLYLYWFPMNHGVVHSGDNGRYHSVFINGEKAGQIGQWGALDASALLQPGENRIDLQLFGSLWNGRIFLSTEAPAVYPYLGRDRNRLFLLWQDWHTTAKYQAWVDILDGMRQVDPDRPIKYMAPIKFGADRWLKLARDWGGFPHFTGEGMWYFPWYKRYSFLYDLPASSEGSGPYDNVGEMFNGFRRTFLAGLNAHDPVFLAQTYTRPPEMRQWWSDHNPVLKRMGKYDLAGPQVLLYRSSRTPDTSGVPSPYPQVGQSAREVQNAWNWDLGRGTLQTLGQSCLYLDDGGLTDGKMVGYPLMIDCGNETMPEEAVAAIAAWVQAGGTFVTLPFSGRNSRLEPDSWPLRQLTGCSIAKMRATGRGQILFGKDQKVFKAFAGKSFPDSGKSLDWVGNNLNEISTELQPGPASEVLATFENGAPAIVRRHLGAGQVIVLGTAFWRQSQDRQGIWWPEALETDFIADLLAGVGFAPAACTTDDRLVWPQPYRANNGLDAVTCLVNWHDDRDSTVTVRLRLPEKPARLVCHGIGGTKDLEFAWADGIATAKVQMPAKEVKVIDAAVYTPRSALEHWWQYQQRLWHELVKPTVDFTAYRSGKWADPTLDLRAGGAEMALTEPVSASTKWQPCEMSILNFYGAPAKRPVWVRKRFATPADWQGQGGRIFLVSGAWSGPQYQGAVKLSLNGTVLHDFPGSNYQDFDVTRLLRDNANELLCEFKGDSDAQGFVGNVYLYRRAPPAKRFDLSGTWQAEDAGGAPVTATFPGTAQVWTPARTIRIPGEWQGKYQVRLFLEGGSHDTVGVYVNGNLVRRHHHWLGSRGDLDLTRFLRFGEDNRLVLMHVYGNEPRDPKRPPKWNLGTVALDLYQAQ